MLRKSSENIERNKKRKYSRKAGNDMVCENKPCLLAFPIIKGYFSYDHKYTINHDMHFFL